MQRRTWERVAPLALFVLAAWPVWVVSVPPLQDLPNHLASAFVQSHPGRYPELVSNGFWKTNATLFLFLHVASKVVSLRVAAKLFVTLTCGVAAFAYPRAVKALGGSVGPASLLLWPFVQNWFVAMGMLDYALGVALAMLVLAELQRRPVVAAGLAVLVWYTHAFAVVVLVLLVGLEAASRIGRGRGLLPAAREFARLGAPLAPAVALTALSSLVQLASETHVGRATYRATVPALAYGLFAEWFWPMTKWTLPAFACFVVLAWYGVRRWRARPAFFSPLAMGALLALYVALPDTTHRWYYVNARILPFLWMGCVLRVPEELPLWVTRSLGACAIAFSAGLGVEYVHIAHDWDVFTRGEVAVPEGARLLPLVFDRKGPHGDNTWPMLQAWGLYVIDRGTSAPLVFAHSRSFPVSYAREPSPMFHGITLENFPQEMRTARDFCGLSARAGPAPDYCEREYRAAWDAFWREAAPRFDRALLYGVTPDARAALPPSFRVVFEEGETLVLATAPLGPRRGS